MGDSNPNPVKTETTNSSSNVTLKLLINKKSQQVVYAEANKDFIDFLFSLTVLPTGTTIRLLSMQCGLSNLCKSISDLNTDYIQPNQNKTVLLKPNSLFPFCSTDQPYLLPTKPFLSPSPVPNATAPYKCLHCKIIISSCLEGKCPKCRRVMTATDDTFVLKSYADAKGGGFVKGLVKYMVMDDLTVSPLSTVSNIGLLSKFNVKDLSDLEERVVRVGMNEGLELLKHSLNSKTVLTDVFLGEVAVMDEVGVKDGSMKKRKANGN